METDTTGKVKVVTKKEESVITHEGEYLACKIETYKSSFKVTYNPESNNTQFFLEVLGHVWMSLKGVWPNAPKMVLRWEGETERGVRPVNIQEATKQGENGTKIRPTDTDECCIVSRAKKEAPRWNPQAEDLTADDWVVTE